MPNLQNKSREVLGGVYAATAELRRIETRTDVGVALTLALCIFRRPAIMLMDGSRQG